LWFDFWNDSFYILSPPIGETGWDHVVCTFDNSSSSRRFYVNGSLVASNTAAYGFSGDGSFVLDGGARAMAYDEVRFYNRALSLQEVQSLYAYERNPIPNLTIAVKTIRLTLFVVSGKTYQLESSIGLNDWAPYGASFTPLFDTLTQDVEVTGSGQLFRIKQVSP
jgi:hypothetical protein